MFPAVQHLDYNIVQTWADFTVSHYWASLIIYVCAEILILVPFIVLALLWIKPEAFSAHKATKKAVVMAVATLIGSLAMKALISFVFARVRPFIAHPELLHLPLKVDSASFPSGHTLLAFSVGFSLLWSKFKHTGTWLLVLACVIGAARVAAGVHYPTDILGGIAVAFISAWLVHREASALKQYLPNS